MEQAEIEALVGELETRIDRLRSLYDMYFMGIERLEPLVPRKDVERRVAALRKEQIRNTGLRFKFNVIIQRFNTYQTYWQRISRQIEQGTYRRDVMRATARFGIDPTKEQPQRTSEPGSEEATRAKAPAPREFVLDESMDELEDGSAFLLPLDEGDPFAEAELGAVAAKAPAAGGALPAAREKFGSTVRLDLDDLGDPFEEHDPFPRPAIPSLGPKMRIAPRPGASGAPGPASLSAPAAQTGEDARSLDPRIPAAAAPRIALRGGSLVPPGVQGSAAPPPIMRGNEPRVIVAKRGSIPDEVERGMTARPAAPNAPPALQRPATGPAIVRAPGVAPASRPSVSQAAQPPAVSSPPPVAPPPRPPAAPPPPTGLSAARVPVAAPSKPSLPGAPPPPRVALAAPSPPRGAAPVPVIPAAASPAIAAARPPPAPAVVARAAPPAPAVRPAPAAPPPTPARAPAVGDLSGDRFGEIYSKYVETRRERNEPTHAITREALAKQLSESTERLKQKHGGKPIDFEVVVKEGKTILRPIVK